MARCRDHRPACHAQARPARPGSSIPSTTTSSNAMALLAKNTLTRTVDLSACASGPARLHVVIDDLLHDLALKFDGELVSIDRSHRAIAEHRVRDQMAECELARAGGALCKRRFGGLRLRRRFLRCTALESRYIFC